MPRACEQRGNRINYVEINCRARSPLPPHFSRFLCCVEYFRDSLFTPSFNRYLPPRGTHSPLSLRLVPLVPTIIGVTNDVEEKNFNYFVSLVRLHLRIYSWKYYTHFYILLFFVFLFYTVGWPLISVSSLTTRYCESFQVYVTVLPELSFCLSSVPAAYGPFEAVIADPFLLFFASSLWPLSLHCHLYPLSMDK